MAHRTLHRRPAGKAFSLFLASALFLSAHSGEEQGNIAHGELLLFVQSEGHEGDINFLKDEWPALLAVATEEGIPARLIEISEGEPPPEDIVLTPSLVLQNHRGRSVYQGRTTTPERFRRFLRTARFLPQGTNRIERSDVGSLSMGRASIATPLKVTDLSGSIGEDFDQASFRTEASNHVRSGWSQLTPVARVLADRSFYFDVYPWKGDDNSLWISLAVYSQFHCKTPVWVVADADKPHGSWKDRREIFTQAGVQLEKALLRLIETDRGGDAFSPVSSNARAPTWNDAGLPLPPAPENHKQAVPTDIELPFQWIVAPQRSDDPPRLLFHLAEPLQSYVGEAEGLSGSLTLPDADSSQQRPLEGAQGTVIVSTRTVTMGEADLDEAVASSLILHASRFPEARFVVKEVEAQDPIAWGHVTPAQFSGTFTMRGVSAPLVVTVELEPTLDEVGQPAIFARGWFTLRLAKPFGIVALDEPQPAADTLLFDVTLRLIPAPEK